MESLELPQDILWDGDQSPTLSPAHLSNASGEEILIFEDSFAIGKNTCYFYQKAILFRIYAQNKECNVCFSFPLTELIPNDDLIKPNQNIEFCPEEFEQLLDIQQDLLNNMADEAQDQSNGESTFGSSFRMFYTMK